MHWDHVDICEAVHAGLLKCAQEIDAEQAVYGIDALDELGLHPLIQQPLRDAGFGVWPEQAYPSDRIGRKRRSEGKRCDIVLTPDERELVDPEAEATLFEPPDTVALESAYWLEIKTVSQYTTDGPFPHYSKELLSPVREDLRKLAQDPLIYHSGLMLVLFTEDPRVAQHDLELWEMRCLQKGYPIAPPVRRDFAITERMGNALCTVALFPVRRL
ncbi:MAG: hypothetical protein GC159_04555 [Phycisphaera sp.]|nr:hypothetical protein [Phycisphaera sp.]